MSIQSDCELNLLPGQPWVLLLIRMDKAQTVLAVHSSRLLEGLKAATASLSFSGLHRDDDSLDELLPWTGSV
jgi:hypothetical protein